MTAPEGYTTTASAGGNDAATELACDTCGASVRPQAADRHIAWHQTVITESNLVNVLNTMSDRQRYNP